MTPISARRPPADPPAPPGRPWTGLTERQLEEDPELDPDGFTPASPLRPPIGPRKTAVASRSTEGEDASAARRRAGPEARYTTSLILGKLLLVVIAAICCTGAQAQTTWAEQTSPVNTNLFGVALSTATVGYVVGRNGVILSTTDGGSTWTQQDSTVTDELRSVAFPTATVGYVVGKNGVILGTTDGGSTWTPQTSTVTVDLKSTAFQTATVGYAVGDDGVILGTTDGGSTWTAQSHPGGTTSFRGVALLTATVGYVVGTNGVILSTTDGGSTWTQQTSTVTDELRSVAFPTATVGYVVGDDVILGTTDGGSTWTPQTTTGTVDLKSTAFQTATVGYAVGDDGVILGTTDGGSTWAAQSNPEGTTPLRGVALLTGPVGYVVGKDGVILGAQPTAAPTATPTTDAPTAAPTGTPTTGAPTAAPTTAAPITSAPTTGAATTGAPTAAPTTAAPITSAPTTGAATTGAPTAAPTTAAPITSAPTTSAATTGAPTAAPTTGTPTVTPTTSAPTFVPTVSAMVQAAQGTAIYGTMGAAAAVSVLASGGVSTSTSSAAKTLGTVAYAKNTPYATVQAGMMTPILFGMPSFSPLYGGPCPNGEPDCCPTMAFFGVEALTVASNLVYLVMTVLSSVVFLVVFALRAPSFDVTRPPLPGHKPQCCTLATISDYFMCCTLGALECDLRECFADLGEYCCLMVAAGSGGMIEVAELGVEAGDAAVAAVEEATGAGSGAAVEIEIPGMGAPGLVEELDAPSAEEAACAPQPPSSYERLWPLAMSLWYVIGYIQFNGLALCLLYVLSLDECGSGWPWTGALIMTMTVLLWFPISVLHVCWVKFPQAVADRQARENGPPWVKSYDHQHATDLYYNVKTEESQWEVPAEYTKRHDEVQARLYEERHGIDCLIADYHGTNLISRFYPLVELADALINVLAVLTYYWQYTTGAAIGIAIAKGAEAVLATLGLPLIDGSDSQRNVENWATAVSLWLMTAGMVVLCFDVHLGEMNMFRQWMFTALALLSMLVVPVCTWLDQKFPPKEEQPADEQPVQIVDIVIANPIFDNQEETEPETLEGLQVQGAGRGGGTPEHEDPAPRMQLSSAKLLASGDALTSGANKEDETTSEEEGQDLLDDLREQWDEGGISEAEYRMQQNLIERRYGIRAVHTLKSEPASRDCVGEMSPEAQGWYAERVPLVRKLLALMDVDQNGTVSDVELCRYWSAVTGKPINEVADIEDSEVAWLSGKRMEEMEAMMILRNNPEMLQHQLDILAQGQPEPEPEGLDGLQAQVRPEQIEPEAEAPPSDQILAGLENLMSSPPMDDQGKVVS